MSATKRPMPAGSGRAVIYLRVSTKDQASVGGEEQGYSIPAQRRACLRHAKSLSAEVVEEFTDAGESAKTADRPELQRMLQRVAEGGIDYVIVHKVDRLAHNRADDVMINLQLQQAGARLVSCSENIDETPSGMLMYGILSTIAEFYARNLGTEALKGMQQKAMRGGTNGKAPLGYRNVAKYVDGREVRTVELDPDRAHLMAWAFEAYATGEHTVASLQRELSARGLTIPPGPKRTEKPVSVSRLTTLLQNRYYLGKVVFMGVEYEGQHPAIVSLETFTQVASIISSHRVGEKQREHPHHLKGTIFCGRCESRLSMMQITKRSGAVYQYFYCLGRHQKRTGCQAPYISVSAVERAVEREWREVRIDPHYGALLQELVESEVSAMDAANVKIEDRVRLQLGRKREQRRKLLEANYEGAIPIDLLKSEQLSLGRDIEQLELMLARARIKVANLELALRKTLEFLYEPYETYMAAPSQLRRQLNQAIFERILIDEHGPAADVELAEPFNTLLQATWWSPTSIRTGNPAAFVAASPPT